MPVTAHIVIVGLCSILNMNGTDPNMAAPSVVCEAPAHDSFKHIAFIAFKKGEFTSATPNMIHDVPGSNGTYQYVQPQGEEISLGVDVSKVPNTSDPLLAQLARMPSYAKLPKPPQYNHDHIPEHGKKPTNVVGSFMRLGEGVLRGDFLTKDVWVFRNVKDFSETSISGRFVREIHYDFPLPQHFAMALRPLGTGTNRTLTAKTPSQSDIWVGSSPVDDIIKHIRRFEPSTPGGGTHFEMYYDQVAGPHKTFIPYPASLKSAPKISKMMMPDLGYCGPDGQP